MEAKTPRRLTQNLPNLSESENWIRFTFGPDWAFCLWTKQRARWNIRGDDAAINAWRALRLDKVFRVSWTVDGGWIVTGVSKENGPLVAYYSDKSGTVAVCNAKRWAERHEGYEELFEALQRETAGDKDKLARANWSIGPGGCWWAKIGDNILEHDIPQALELMMEKNAKKGVRTEHVALGKYGSYVAFWTDGTRTWSLQNYDKLHDYLNSDGQYVYVALSPVDCGKYFLVDQVGTVAYSINSWLDSMDEIHTMTNAYMQSRASSDGSTFKISHSARRKIFEVNINLPDLPGFWRNRTSGNTRQTTSFKAVAGATAAAAVVGAGYALPTVRRWRADALKRPGTFSAKITRVTPLRALGRRLRPAATSVLPIMIGFPAGWYLNGWYNDRPRVQGHLEEA